MVLLYDGDCFLCKAGVRFLAARKGSERLRFVPLQEPGALEEYGISAEAAIGALHAVDGGGEIFIGADAVIHSMATLPRYRWLTALTVIPGTMPIARVVYGWVARFRPRDKCDSNVCRS